MKKSLIWLLLTALLFPTLAACGGSIPDSTDAPTDAPSDKPTDEPTEEVSESESATAPAEQSGCGAALGASAVSLIGAASAAALTLKKKKED